MASSLSSRWYWFGADAVAQAPDARAGRSEAREVGPSSPCSALLLFVRRERRQSPRGDPLPLARGRRRAGGARWTEHAERGDAQGARRGARTSRRSPIGSGGCFDRLTRHALSRPRATISGAGTSTRAGTARRTSRSLPARRAGRATTSAGRRQSRAGRWDACARLVVPLRRRRARRLWHLGRRQRGVGAAGARDRQRPRERSSRSIPRTRACSLAWTPDGSGFYYTRYPKPGRGPARRGGLSPRRLPPPPGRRPGARPQIFGDGRDRTDWPGVDLSPDGRWLVVSVAQGWTKSEVHSSTRTATGRRSRWPPGRTRGSTSSQALDDRLYLLTTSGAAARASLRGRPRSRPARTGARSSPKAKTCWSSAVYFRGGLAVGFLHDAAARLSVRRGTAVPAARYRCRGSAPDGAVGGAATSRSSSTGSPASWRRPRSSTFTSAPRPDVVWRALAAPIDAAAFEVERVMVTSRDGTRLPLFLAHTQGHAARRVPPGAAHRLRRLRRQHAAGLDGVGDPVPRERRHLRAGGPARRRRVRRGLAPRRHARAKQNVFDDFIAAADWLVAPVTTSRRLAISGGSNGGLLVGAAFTQRPELFRAVVCNVPLLDMLRYHLFRLAQLWIPEYGSPDDAGGRPLARRLLAVPPRARRREVSGGVSAHGGLRPRVDPLHARKMAAGSRRRRPAAARSCCGWREGRPRRRASRSRR